MGPLTGSTSIVVLFALLASSALSLTGEAAPTVGDGRSPATDEENNSPPSRYHFRPLNGATDNVDSDNEDEDPTEDEQELHRRGQVEYELRRNDEHLDEQDGLAQEPEDGEDMEQAHESDGELDGSGQDDNAGYIDHGDTIELTPSDFALSNDSRTYDEDFDYGSEEDMVVYKEPEGKSAQ